MNSAWLKGQMFGMPRWAWFLLLGGGIAAGLYWRSKSLAAEAEAEAEPTEDELAAMDEAAYALDASQDPSLAGMGYYPETGGGYYPWQTDSTDQVTRDLITALLGGRSEDQRRTDRELDRIRRELARIRRRPKRPTGGGRGRPNKGGKRRPKAGGPAQGGPRRRRQQARRHQPTGGGPPQVGPYRRLTNRRPSPHRQ